MSNPKKQHYVPQTYLRNFTDQSGYIQVYDKNMDQYFKQTPANAGYSKHFYTVDINGDNDFFIEKLLAEHVDSLLSPIIRKIEEGELITDQDKKDIAIFLTFQHLRTPAQRKNYNNMVDQFYKKVNKILFSMKKVNGKLEYSDEEISQIENIFKNEEYKVIVPKEQSLAFMLDFSEEMSRMLANHNIIILEASQKSEFITSDNPYCMVKEKWSLEYSGYGVINTTKVFPLTPRYLLILKDPGKKVIKIKQDKAVVREFNFLIAKWADRFLFSRNELLLKSLVRKLKNKGK